MPSSLSTYLYLAARLRHGEARRSAAQRSHPLEKAKAKKAKQNKPTATTQKRASTPSPPRLSRHRSKSQRGYQSRLCKQNGVNWVGPNTTNTNQTKKCHTHITSLFFCNKVGTLSLQDENKGMAERNRRKYIGKVGSLVSIQVYLFGSMSRGAGARRIKSVGIRKRSTKSPNSCRKPRD